MQSFPAISPNGSPKCTRPRHALYHLGLGSVSPDQILPLLSPGVNVLTTYPRYYSFYTFLLDEFRRRDRPRSRAAWVPFVFTQ